MEIEVFFTSLYVHFLKWVSFGIWHRSGLFSVNLAKGEKQNCFCSSDIAYLMYKTFVSGIFQVFIYLIRYWTLSVLYSKIPNWNLVFLLDEVRLKPLRGDVRTEESLHEWRSSTKGLNHSEQITAYECYDCLSFGDICYTCIRFQTSCISNITKSLKSDKIKSVTNAGVVPSLHSWLQNIHLQSSVCSWDLLAGQPT